MSHLFKEWIWNTFIGAFYFILNFFGNMQFSTLRSWKKTHNSTTSCLSGQLGHKRTKYNFDWRVNDHIKQRPVTKAFIGFILLLLCLTLLELSSVLFLVLYVDISYQLYKEYWFNCNFIKNSTSTLYYLDINKTSISSKMTYSNS